MWERGTSVVVAEQPLRNQPVRGILFYDQPMAGAVALIATAGERGAGGQTDAQRLRSPHSGNAQDARCPSTAATSAAAEKNGAAGFRALPIGILARACDRGCYMHNNRLTALAV